MEDNTQKTSSIQNRNAIKIPYFLDRLSEKYVTVLYQTIPFNFLRNGYVLPLYYMIKIVKLGPRDLTVAA